MTRFSKWLVAAPLVLAMGACGSREPVASESIPPREPVAVSAETLVPTDRIDSLRVVGTVRSQQTAFVSSRLLASVLAVHAREGEQVQKGKLLIELDHRELTSAVAGAEAARAEAESAIRAVDQSIAAARAELDLANVTHRRFEDLLKKESVSQQEYDESVSRVRLAEAGLRGAESRKEQAERKREQAEAAIAMAQTRLSYAAITASASGTVVERLVDPGSMANPGAPLMKIEPAGRYWLEVGVPESNLGRLRKGETLSVRLDALGEAGQVEGRIVEIVPIIDSASRTFTVKLALPTHSSIRSGLYGSAVIPGATRQAMVVSAPAVVEHGQLKSVFVVEDGAAKRRLVTLGEADDQGFEVLSGLVAGDEVVLNPSDVSDGSPVRLIAGQP